MNKKIVIASIILIIILLAINNNKQDIKKEYENLNNKNNYIKVNIPKDIVFQKINACEFISKTKKTSVIFIGRSKDNTSRNSINVLSKAANNTGIDKIYYVDINQIKNKNIIKKYKIKKATLLVFKNGKKIDYINNSNDKMTKKELEKEYEKAINKILVCNPSGTTC